MERERTRFQGVYQRQHSSRRHLGKPDICYDITYKTPDGKKVWEKVGWVSEGYTAQVASEVRAERVRTLRHGDLVVRKKTLRFADGWERYKSDWLYQVKTANEDIRRYHAYLERALADKPMSAIGALELERLKGDMARDGYSPQTIKHALGLVRRVYRKLGEWGVYKGAVPKISMPRVDAARTRYLSEKEAQDLLSELLRRSQLWHDVAFLSLHSGMRLGEVLALRWEDVTYESGHIHIRDAKSGSRVAYMSTEVAAMLKSRGTRPLGLIFATRAGNQVTRGANSFKRAVEALKLNEGITDRRQRVVFHTLRHTFASWLAIRGVPLYVIGELLGHKTLEMTKRYSHLCPDAKQQAVALIGRSLADQ